MPLIRPSGIAAGATPPSVLLSDSQTIFASAALPASGNWSTPANQIQVPNARLAHLRIVGTAAATGNIIQIMPLRSEYAGAATALTTASFHSIAVTAGTYTAATVTGTLPTGYTTIPLVGAAPITFNPLVIVTPASAAASGVYFDLVIPIEITGARYFTAIAKEVGQTATPSTCALSVHFSL